MWKEDCNNSPVTAVTARPLPRMASTKRLPEAFALLVFLAAFFYIPARGLELRSLHAATPLAPAALDSATPLDASDDALGPPQEYGSIPDDPKAPPPRAPAPEGEAPARPTPAHMGKDHLVMKGYNAGNPTPEMKAAEKKVNDELAEDVKARAEERADNDGVVMKASGQKKCDPEADAAKAKAKAEGEAAANKAAPLPDAAATAKAKAEGERGQHSEREEELTHAKGHPVKGGAEAADTAAKVAPGGAAGSEGEAKGAKGGSKVPEKASLAKAITSAGSEAEARR